MRTIPDGPPGEPDTASTGQFLWWLGRHQLGSLIGGIVCGVTWMLCQALLPAALGSAIDQGITGDDRSALVRWSAAIFGLGVLGAISGTLRHRFAVTNWLRATFRTAQLVGHKTADTGAALTRTVPTGDVVAAVASDAMRVGGLYDVMARFAGAIVSFVVVAVILLRASRELGLFVLIGVPVMLTALSLIVRPLQRRQAEQREQSGRLIGLGADTVAGLRVLRGIGGEATFLSRYERQSTQVRLSGYRVAGVQAALDSSQVLLPGIFVLLVAWFGARFALDGRITAGQLVAFYGYSAFLVTPLRTATEFVDRFTRARIGAGKIRRILAARPDQPVASTEHAPAPIDWSRAELHDRASGLRVSPGELTALVSARPETSAALADRLGRFGAERPGPLGVTVAGVDLAFRPVTEIRANLVVSEADPRLFTGSLRTELDPWGRHGDDDIAEAIEVASGADVLEALDGGLDARVEERGRSFSGGQRQRLALTRALLTEAPVLVLVEPTSAVDAHTEARIALRLADARRGRTTVIATASPLVLDVADRVVLLEDGAVVAEGRHRDLLASAPAYRSVVARGEAG